MLLFSIFRNITMVLRVLFKHPCKYVLETHSRFCFEFYFLQNLALRPKRLFARLLLFLNRSIITEPGVFGLLSFVLENDCCVIFNHFSQLLLWIFSYIFPDVLPVDSSSMNKIFISL